MPTRLLAFVIVSLPLVAQAAELSVDEFQYIADRSPSVFDTFFYYQNMYEQRLPHFYVEGDIVIGPEYEAPMAPGTTIATKIMGGA